MSAMTDAASKTFCSGNCRASAATVLDAARKTSAASGQFEKFAGEKSAAKSHTNAAASKSMNSQ